MQTTNHRNGDTTSRNRLAVRRLLPSETGGRKPALPMPEKIADLLGMANATMRIGMRVSGFYCDTDGERRDFYVAAEPLESAHKSLCEASRAIGIAAAELMKIYAQLDTDSRRWIDGPWAEYE